MCNDVINNLSLIDLGKALNSGRNSLYFVGQNESPIDINSLSFGEISKYDEDNETSLWDLFI